MATYESAEKIDFQPWEYALYKVNGGLYFLRIPYSPKSFVDTTMCIELSDKEISFALSKEGWLGDFSRQIRENYDDYRCRSISKDEEQEIFNLAG